MGLLFKAALIGGAFVAGIVLILALVNQIPGVDVSVLDVLKTLIYTRAGAV